MTKKIINNSISLLLFIIIYFYAIPNDKAFSDIVTFISISTGFCVTALSIIATSDFSKSLYQKEVKGDNSKTLLHQLVGSFKYSVFIFTATICIILLYKLIDPKTCILHILNKPFDWVKIFVSFIWYLTSVSIIRFIILVKLFAQFVIKSAN